MPEVKLPDTRVISQPISTLTNEPIYELVHKDRHQIQRILFQSSDLQSAIKKGEKYCQARRFRFITVGPFIQDIDALIKKAEEQV